VLHFRLSRPPPPKRDCAANWALRDLVLFNIAAVIGIRWLAAAAHIGPAAIVLWLLAAAFFFIPSALAVAALSEKFPEGGSIAGQLLVDMSVIVYFIPFLYMFGVSWKFGCKWSAGCGLAVTVISIAVSYPARRC